MARPWGNRSRAIDETTYGRRQHSSTLGIRSRLSGKLVIAVNETMRDSPAAVNRWAMHSNVELAPPLPMVPPGLSAADRYAATRNLVACLRAVRPDFTILPSADAQSTVQRALRPIPRLPSPVQSGEEKLIYRTDDRALSRAVDVVRALELKWEGYTRNWERKAGKQFAERFTEWLGSVPDGVVLELDPALASLRAPTSETMRPSRATVGPSSRAARTSRIREYLRSRAVRYRRSRAPPEHRR